MTDIFQILNERSKELNCLYATDELLKDKAKPFDIILMELIKIMPAGWQYSTICDVKIIINNKEYKLTKFKESKYVQTADIVIEGNRVGKIEVYYSQFIKTHNNKTQFLLEEQKLLNTIADRLASYMYINELKKEIKLLKSKK